MRPSSSNSPSFHTATVSHTSLGTCSPRTSMLTSCTATISPYKHTSLNPTPQAPHLRRHSTHLLGVTSPTTHLRPSPPQMTGCVHFISLPPPLGHCPQGWQLSCPISSFAACPRSRTPPQSSGVIRVAGGDRWGPVAAACPALPLT